MSFVINTAEDNFFDTCWDKFCDGIGRTYKDFDELMYNANLFLKPYNATIAESPTRKGWDITFETEEDILFFKLSL